MDIRVSSAHFEQIVNDIVCVNCLIEFYLMFFSFYKDTNKYVYKKEKLKIFLFFYVFCEFPFQTLYESESKCWVDTSNTSPSVKASSW